MPPWKADPADGPFIGQHPLTAARDCVAPTLGRQWRAGGRCRRQIRNPQSAIRNCVVRRLATRKTRSGHYAAAAVHAAGGRHRRVSHLRAADSGGPRTLRARPRVPSRQRARRASRQHPHRHDAGIAPSGRGRSRAGLRRADRAIGDVSRRPFPRLDAGAGRAAAARRISRGASRRTPTSSSSCTCSRAARPEQVSPSIGLYFGDTAPTRTPAMLRLGRQDIDIPAGDAHYVVTDSYTLPVDVEVEAVQPHAHYRARDVRGEATLPDGSTKRLIDIADWDFRWQHVYRFVTPLQLAEGHDGVDALHLRQLAGQRAQSAAAAGARALGPAIGGGDGRPVAAGAAARRPRPGAL